MATTDEIDPEFDGRPWGTFQVLDDQDRHWVKHITRRSADRRLLRGG